MGEDVPGPLTKRGLPRQIIVIHPELSVWVIRIFHWFVVDRLPLARILERLNDQEVPPGPKSDGSFWTEQALHYLLSNESYRGLLSYGAGEYIWQSKTDYSKRVMREAPSAKSTLRNSASYPTSSGTRPKRSSRRPPSAIRAGSPRTATRRPGPESSTASWSAPPTKGSSKWAGATASG